MNAVFERAAQELDAGHDVVLVTIIDSSGSSPRKTGSCMVVSADGRLAGTIGGGNIEFRSDKMARELLAQKTSCLHTFVLNKSDTEGLGMVCGGDVDVWFQFISPADDAWRKVIQSLAEAKSDQGGWFIQSLAGSTPALLSAQKELLAGTMPDSVDELCTPSCVREGGYYSLPLPKKERAIVFGGGHIGQALVPLLASVDFRPVVFDSRPEFADPTLFPCAEDVILGDYEAISDYIELNPDDFTVIVTHSHAFDYATQAQLLRHDLAYIGAIGSAPKTRLLRDKLREEGFSEERIAFAHMPVGIKIGGVTPAEIAVSIVAEMIAVRAEQRKAALKKEGGK